MLVALKAKLFGIAAVAGVLAVTHLFAYQRGHTAGHNAAEVKNAQAWAALNKKTADLRDTVVSIVATQSRLLASMEKVDEQNALDARAAIQGVRGCQAGAHVRHAINRIGVRVNVRVPDGRGVAVEESPASATAGRASAADGQEPPVTLPEALEDAAACRADYERVARQVNAIIDIHEAVDK